MKICKVEGCVNNPSISNKYSRLCEIHRYNLYKYKTYNRPIKPTFKDGIVKICKKNGELTKDKVTLNRKSPKGKEYLNCKKCRNSIAKNYLERNKYVITPRKHTKNKLPSYIKDDEEKIHAYTILHRFTFTIEEYRKLLLEQNNVCAICKNPETQIKRKSNRVKMLSIDHCHKSLKIRGLLCSKCNTALGGFKDSIEILQLAIEYLKKSI